MKSSSGQVEPGFLPGIPQAKMKTMNRRASIIRKVLLDDQQVQDGEPYALANNGPKAGTDYQAGFSMLALQR